MKEQGFLPNPLADASLMGRGSGFGGVHGKPNEAAPAASTGISPRIDGRTRRAVTSSEWVVELVALRRVAPRRAAQRRHVRPRPVVRPLCAGAAVAAQQPPPLAQLAKWLVTSGTLPACGERRDSASLDRTFAGRNDGGTKEARGQRAGMEKRLPGGSWPHTVAAHGIGRQRCSSTHLGAICGVARWIPRSPRDPRLLRGRGILFARVPVGRRDGGQAARGASSAGHGH